MIHSTFKCLLLCASAGLVLASPATLARTAGEPVGAPSTGTVHALTNTSVVDVDTGRALSQAVVVVADGRIQAVGPAASVAIPAGAKVVDMQGRYLVPGLMNMHVHLGLKLPGLEGLALANENLASQALRMAGNARKSLLAGTTTVRLVGEENGVDFDLRRAIDGGTIPGPRIKTAGSIIAITGGHGDSEADGADALVTLARKQIKQGADVVKIATSGGISDVRGSIAGAVMTNAELGGLIDASHRLGIKVTAHNGSPLAAKQALDLGIDGFEHGYFLTPDNLKQMKAQGAWLVPTMVVSQPGAIEFYQKIGSPGWYLERVKSVGKDHWAVLQTAIKLGVNVALGTDQFPFEPNDGTVATVAEAELYAKAGMTPLQALQAATIQPARMMGIEDSVGRLKVGQYADLIAVAANPAQDISALRTISFVMKDGTIYRDDGRDIGRD
jgi:imidazolonepropionase-like amidohydrolase